jgi:hypothetical protein
MDSSTNRNNINKGEKGAGWHERRAFQQERDDRIIGWVNTLEVVTIDLMCAFLDLAPTPSHRKIVERRMHRLSKNHFNHMTQDGVSYFVTLDISPRKKTERTQLPHRLMESRWMGTLMQATPVRGRRTGRSLRAAGGSVIPDGFVILERNNKGILLEDDRGDEIKDIRAKSERYYKDREYLADQFDVPRLQVVWNVRRESRVKTVATALQGIGTGAMFLLGYEDHFSPHNPLSMLQPIFFSPLDSHLHTLLD